MRVRGRLAGQAEAVDVVLTGDRITAVEAPQGTPDHGGDDLVLAPAFIDLQLNGYGGHDFNSGAWNVEVTTPDEAVAIVDQVAASGTGVMLPTLVTNTPDNLIQGLRSLVAARRDHPAVAAAVPGVHLEGPFLSPDDGPRGAHELKWILDPDWDLLQRLQDAADGLVKVLTIAPERPGALGVIAKAVAAGIIVSIGHANPSVDDVRAAVDAGATLSTHLGNGSHAMIQRHPNYIWEQLAADELTAGVIADLHHVPASVLKCFARIKGVERLCVVSDVVALGGLPAGIYDHGRHEVLPSGRVNLAGTPYLAGAGHLLDTCLANIRRATDLSEADAVATVTRIPARVLGLTGELGAVAAGYRADLTGFRWPVNGGPVDVAFTIVAGQVRYQAGE